MSARSFDINVTKKQSNVQVIRSENSIHVRLHSTIVLSAKYDCILLNSGGYRTVTTKTAINRGLSQLTKGQGYAVVQKKGQWFVSAPDNSLVEFVDGMSINF